jgi:hypothetical protein
MPESPLQTQVREKLGLRVGKEMAAYILRKLDQSADTPIPIMAGDARTGVPIHREIPASELAPIASPQPNP